MKTLRRRLFGSHMLVIAVALCVVLIGALLFVAVLELTGAHGRLGLGREGDGGVFGLMFGLAAAAIASGVVSWRVSRRLAEPLEEIGAATRNLAAGRYDTRLPAVDTAELDALATDVNQLATELESTEQRRLRLIGDVAHELRNPLSTIEGTMEALLDGVVEADADTYARVGREAARLRRLADDLSTLSAAGEFGVEPNGAVDLGALTSAVVAQLEPQALAKGLALEVAADPDLMVPGDRDRLTQVLTNIVGNAVQYTDEGSVSVRVVADDGAAVVEVTDTGRGLDAEHIPQVFERFFRVDEHYSDGTGVGLAIAKLIVDAHSGRISVTSSGAGRGSTFRVELPMS